MAGTPLVVGTAERQALEALRAKAAAAPVNIAWLADAIKLPKVKAKHMEQMTAQTIGIPFGFAVTFSIETNHPGGKIYRHMSMSSPKVGRVPSPEAMWMVATELGFTGSIDQCVVQKEELKGHGLAINLMQAIEQTAEAGRA